MSIKNKAVLVTGGAGFIGSHLVDRLIDEGTEKVVAVDSFFLGKERNLSDAFERDPGLVLPCPGDKRGGIGDRGVDRRAEIVARSEAVAAGKIVARDEAPVKF